jgi:hypothetical protein
MRSLQTLKSSVRLTGEACRFSYRPRSSLKEARIALERQHTPVLLKQVVEAFRGKYVKVCSDAKNVAAIIVPFVWNGYEVCCPEQVYIDCTLGAAGHAAAILEDHPV